MTVQRPVAAVLLAAAVLLHAGAAWAGPRAVVELFTSQGCSACPPADRVLADLAEEADDVLALTMPVSIWDYLGWKDTLALPKLTARQKAYSVVRGDHAVYTPQAVINGRGDVVGSDRDAIAARIAADNADGPALPLAVALERVGDVLAIRVGRAGAPGMPAHAKVWLAVFDERVAVPVKGGENRGRRLAYHNVVRSLRPVGMWRGEELFLEIPIDPAELRVGRGVAVLVQAYEEAGPGRILGANALPEISPARTVRATEE